ncbi:MAG: RDD family protein [Acidobacteriota bacterium]|nr:RDD family protein [Acidobacteriota bacterium]
MAEGYWYYIKDNKQEGPVSEATIQKMFEAGILEKDTLVWSEPMVEWLPASKVDPFKGKAIFTTQTSLSEVISSFPQESEIKTKEKSVPQIRPWVRFWARYIDLMSFSVVVGCILEILNLSILDIPDIADIPEVIILGFLILFLWIFEEAFLLSGPGTTPGKWLLRITLRDSSGGKPTFSSALRRSFSVWWNGLGIGFPIISLITLSVAYSKLTKNGITTWDKNGGFKISHLRIGPLRTIIAVFLVVAFLLLAMLGKQLILNTYLV